jgi:WD40 repeat protein
MQPADGQPDSRAAHPTPSQLNAFGLGRLDDTAAWTVEQHVAACPTCCQKLDAVPADGFLSCLRSAGPTPPMALPVVPSALSNHPRYEVEEVLGCGGMGVVYRARHRLMHRPVALKVIHQHLVGNDLAAERFRREVQAAARLAHPNVVAAYDADQAGALHFLVMEFVEGETLAQRVERQGPLPVAEACEYVRQAALGLQHAFEHGLVHRDLKPHNLMRTPGGVIKILDFGLAGFGRETVPAGPSNEPTVPDAQGTDPEAITAATAVLGTPAYLAPEQASDPRKADVRSDLYGLGCTLYFLLTGRPPFPGNSVSQMLRLHAEAPPPLAQLGREVPAGLRRVLERLLAKDPAERYATPAEVAAALAPYAGRPGRRLRRVVVAAVLAIVVGAVTVAAWPRSGSDRAQPPQSGPAEGVPDLVWQLNAGEGVETVAFTADGLQALVGTTDNSLMLCDVATGKELWRQPVLTPVGASAALSPDGRHALVWSSPPADDGLLRLWNLETRAEVHRWVAHTQGVHQAAFSPDGQRIISCGREDVVRVWDTDGQKMCHLSGHAGSVWCVAITRDGLAASGGADRTVRIWDLKAAEQVRCLRGHAGEVHCLAFAGTDRLVSGSYDTTVRVWDVHSGAPLRRLEGHNFLVEDLSVSRDGRRLLTADGLEIRHGNWVRGPNHGIRLWDLDSGRELERFGHISGGVGAVAFSPDGARALAGGSLDSNLRLWCLDDKKELPTDKLGQVRRFEGPPGCAIHAVAFSPDGTRLAGAGDDKAVWLWDVAGNRELVPLQGHALAVQCVAWSADGTRILSGSSDGTLRLWDAATGEPRAVLQEHTATVWAVAFLDDRRAVSASGDGTVKVWDLGNRVSLQTFTGHTGTVWAVAAALDGRRVYSGGQDLTVRVWEPGRPGEVECWKNQPGQVRNLAVAPDGATVLVVAGNEARLCAAAGGEVQAVLGGHGPDRINDGHQGRVESVAFSRDGRRALSAGYEDNTLRLWDPGANERLFVYRVNGAPRGVAFCPDGIHAACGSQSGCAYLWRLPP